VSSCDHGNEPFGFYQKREISLIDDRLSASQGHSSMNLMSVNYKFCYYVAVYNVQARSAR
jgi:hypothetical protein